VTKASRDAGTSSDAQSRMKTDTRRACKFIAGARSSRISRILTAAILESRRYGRFTLFDIERDAAREDRDNAITR